MQLESVYNCPCYFKQLIKKHVVVSNVQWNSIAPQIEAHGALMNGDRQTDMMVVMTWQTDSILTTTVECAVFDSVAPSAAPLGQCLVYILHACPGHYLCPPWKINSEKSHSTQHTSELEITGTNCARTQDTTSDKYRNKYTNKTGDSSFYLDQ